MILGPVSYLDCLVFCIFLAPQLLIHVGLFETVWVVLQCLPFLVLQLPVQFLRERYLTPRARRSPFLRDADAGPFEDLVIRCVRYAFARLPPRVGRVFFSRPVALPFLRFRMLRHGYVRSPVYWREYDERHFKGVWAIKDPSKKPDVCIYYAHGGGFSMGSSYFYLEFLLTWLSMLEEDGFKNPAIFALEYTLVPDAKFPTQLQEAIAGYRHVLSMVGDASKIVVSGDSAGATIMLSLLLHLAKPGYTPHGLSGVNGSMNGTLQPARPHMAAFISPWVTLISPKHRNTSSDYLDEGNLHQYAYQYVGGREADAGDPLISPGSCRDAEWWRQACPIGGMFFTYGAEEVFVSEIEGLVDFLEKNRLKVDSLKEPGGIHAWPVASLFLCSTAQNRQKGLRSIVQHIGKSIPKG